MGFWPAGLDRGGLSISARVALYAVFGSPIAHSLSPKMHNAAFLQHRPGHYYVPIESSSDKLPGDLEAFRRIGGMGANLTRPLKEGIVPHLADYTDRVARAKAANTIVWSSRGWLGDNTDILALSEKLPPGQGKSAVILGSGGVARASWVALSDRGYQVTVMARHPDQVWAGPVVVSWDWRFLDSGFDVLVNATPVGQQEEASVEVGDLPHLNKPVLIVDWVYTPRLTPFMKWAQLYPDAQLIDGLSLLIGQARWAWNVWFGQLAPEGIFEEAVRWQPL